MFKNYLGIAWRNIRRHKGYSFINIAGLAIGMACSLLILLWVQDELRFDRFHENGDDIYRVIQDIKFSDHDTTWAITQGPLGPSLENDFPEIMRAMRFTWRRMFLTAGDKKFEEILGMADGSIFEMFTFPLVKGDPSTALNDPYSIILSEEMAEKYFPGEELLGKIIQADSRFDFRVTGVMKNIPRRSHLQFDFLIPFIFGRELQYTVDKWNNSQFLTYVQLQKGTPASLVIQKISGYLEGKPTIEKDAKLNLQPLKKIYLYPGLEFEQVAQGDIRYVRIFLLVAFFILFIACINFMNLTTACSAGRAREVGLRKVSGAHKSQLIRQFYGESLLLTGIALLFALILIHFLLSPFNKLTAKELSFDLFGNPWILAGLLGITFLTGILAGSYPALFLSTFQPASVLKGPLSSGSRGKGFRKVLVVFQFSLTIVLMIATVFVYRQLNFMRNYKLGYDKEYVVCMGMRGEIRDKFDTVKSELLRRPEILGVTACSNLPTYGYTFSNSLWRWEGQNPKEEILMRGVFVDVDYFEVLGLKIRDGRSFRQEPDPENNPVFIINEEAARVMGLNEPVGQWLANGDTKGTIVGVVADYHFTPLREKIDPLILIYHPPQSRILFAKLKSDNLSSTIGHIEEVWKRFAPGREFRYRFLDEALDNLYRAEQRIGTIFQDFSLLAIIVSCLGVFGLASFMAERRTKEIGIRKVLGASVSGICFLFSKDFMRCVLISNLIAWPFVYFIIYKWLQGYAYRIGIGVLPFLGTGLLVASIALLTVAYHSIRSARTNPAEAIRYE